MPDAKAKLLAAYPTPVAAPDLVRGGAVAMAALLLAGRYEAARLLDARRAATGDGEVLFIELDIPLGQRPKVNDIRRTEVLAIAFDADDYPPTVYPIRADFPDVPHFNITWSDQPRSLCLFDLARDELLRILTAYVLLERTRHWMVETAYGRLHGEDQPLDPLFGSSGQPVVLPAAGFRAGASVFGFRLSEKPGHPIILRDLASARARGAEPAKGMAALVVTSPPVPHGRIRAVPATAAELLTIFGELGVDLVPLLRDPLRAWTQDAAMSALYDKNLLLVVGTPIERKAGEVDGVSHKAFLCDFTAGSLAEALGAIYRAEGAIGPQLIAPAVDIAKLDTFKLFPMDVHQPFDRDLALRASGIAPRKTQAITLVGAGALGSQVAMTAAREGLGAWTIYDNDHLMPHNLARHALSPLAAGAPKALVIAHELTELLDDKVAAKGVVGDIRQAAPEDLAAADMVIDASASVPVARWLAHGSAHTARSTSVFFNPRGDELVVLAESEGRTTRLDELEMSYYWRLASEDGLDGHLHGGAGILPAGGCRSVSLQVPQSRVSVFAGLTVRSVLEKEPPADGLIEIWRMSDDGVSVRRWPADTYRRVELDGWTVLIRDAVAVRMEKARAAAGGLETGGILVGAWDRQHRRIYIVGVYDPPPDSEHSATGFVRGLVGVYQAVEHVENATALNLTYVGEWHTHPPRHSSRPSQDDANLLRWIGDVVSFSDAPPLMAIAGDDGVRVIVGKIAASAIAKETP